MSTPEAKKRIRKKFFVESIVIFLIVLTPLFLKVYAYFPGSGAEMTNDSISFLGFSIGKNGFDSISTNIWFYTQKAVPLALFIIWFFTSKNWWYHILLIPIATYAFQLFELAYSEDDYVDVESIWWLLPICMVIVPMVYLIRIKLYDKYVHGIDLEAMEAELKSIKSKEIEKSIPIKEEGEKGDDNELSIGYRFFSDYINTKLSTDNIEKQFRRFQNYLKGWLHLKF
ncbi:MAG: hypothetical protein CR994_01420 [Maribacter sp.]|nr:MAG: hypothetical protein CR994_01420 [Maribacter sp.]